jgi:hypothetical protein
MISPVDFPRLTPLNHKVTSPPSPEYNCIAWSAGDSSRWWQPGIFWPIETAANEYGIHVLEELFVSVGYINDETNGDPEPGFEKVALYGNNLFYTHAARQLPNGKWTSKLGSCEDIEHDRPEDVSGGVYSEVVQMMKRPARS